jgi:DNA-binding GntR family transcriptional regulator
MKLPSQAELCAQFNAPRHLLRKALERLVKDNLIVSWQGRGSFVRSDHLIYEIGKRTRFAGNMRRNGCNVRIDVLPSKRPTRASAEVANLLQLSLRDIILVSELIHYVDDVPTAIGRHYFDPKKFPDIQSQINQSNSVPKAFLANGIDDYTRAATFVETRMPTSTEALNLNIPLSQPIMELRGQNENASGQVIEVTEAVVRGDRVKLKI